MNVLFQPSMASLNVKDKDGSLSLKFSHRQILTQGFQNERSVYRPIGPVTGIDNNDATFSF